MPWSTPTLKDVRKLARDNVTALVHGASMVPNNVLRVMSDVMAGLARLVLEYIDWLSKQLLPDTAETEWLDRHGQIWLHNADGTKGRKLPAVASGSGLCTGIAGTVVPLGSELASEALAAGYETLEQVILGTGTTAVTIRALDGGTAGNLDAGTTLQFVEPLDGLDGTVTVVTMTGGTEEESDDDLRARVLLRIQEPPMGGDAIDYVQWALQVPGVTRAWAYPLEMGIGTVTVRFMMDMLRVDNDGFPFPEDVDAVAAYLDTVRPVAVKDFFVVAPIPYPVDMTITNLVNDDSSTRAAIAISLRKLFFERSQPGQQWYRAWSDEGIAGAAGVEHYDLTQADVVMPDNGHMPVLGVQTYG
jgi:uncharacterized phage protein gp47/JayE